MIRKSPFLKIFICLVVLGGIFFGAWESFAVLHRDKIMEAIKKYSGDGVITYLEPPPVPFASYFDGIKVELPIFDMSEYDKTYSLKGLPCFNNYRIYLRWIGESQYHEKPPGIYKLIIYNNDAVLREYDSNSQRVISSYTSENEYYFLEKSGFTGPIIPVMDYPSESIWRIRVKFSKGGGGKAQLVIRYGGVL